MNALDRVKLPGAIRAMALSPTGDRVAVVSRRKGRKRRAGSEPGQVLSLVRLGGGSLQVEQAIPLNGVSTGDVELPEDRSLGVAFRDDTSVVVAWLTSRDFEESVEVFAVDLQTGEQQGRTLELPYPYHVSGLVPGPPGQLLLGTANTVVCLDAQDLSEVCRARQVNDDGECEEEDAVPEEAIAAGGFAWDPARGIVTALTGCFEMGVVSEYQLCDGGSAFERRLRRDLFPSRPGIGSDLPACQGVCLGPDGKGLVAALKLDDLQLDLWGKPVTDADRARDEALARQSREDVPLPARSRVGWLVSLCEGADTWTEILGDTDRDLDGDATTEEDEDGGTVVVGYQACSTDPWDPVPVYVDDRRVAIASPTGLIQLLDPATGEASLEYDAGGPAPAVCFSPRHGCLLVGGADGTLAALGFGGATQATWRGATATVTSESKQ